LFGGSKNAFVFAFYFLSENNFVISLLFLEIYPVQPPSRTTKLVVTDFQANLNIGQGKITISSKMGFLA